jgi:hypothetical protein
MDDLGLYGLVGEMHLKAWPQLKSHSCILHVPARLTKGQARNYQIVHAWAFDLFPRLQNIHHIIYTVQRAGNLIRRSTFWVHPRY